MRMEKSLIANKIFTNKQSLMGLSICLIMWFHTFGGVRGPILSFFKCMCDIGVDIFMLVSGFSIAYSFSRNTNIKSYFTKRILRILPKYFIVFSIVYFYYFIVKGHGSLYDVFYSLFFLNFFIDDSPIIWFIPTILVFYSILPIYYRCIKKYHTLYYLPYLIVFILGICVFFNVKLHNSLLLYRLPIFLIGINIFYNISSTNKELGISKKKYYNMLGIVSLLLCYYCLKVNTDLSTMKYILYIPIAFMIIINYKLPVYINKPLIFLGSITLELYLIHERVQILLFDLINDRLIIFVISVLTSIFLSYIFSKLYNKIYAKLTDNTIGSR